MRSSLIVVCMMLLFSAGCQIFDVDWPRGVTTCKVKGMVTLDGQAISDVKLVFVPQRVGKKGDLNRIASGTSCLLYTSPSPRDRQKSRMPSSA